MISGGKSSSEILYLYLNSCEAHVKWRNFDVNVKNKWLNVTKWRNFS